MSFDLPALPDGWEYRTLETCAAADSISYGVVQPGQAVAQGVPLIRVNNFNDGKIDPIDLMRIDPSIESKYTRTRLSGGEVLISLVGSVGQVAIVPKELGGCNVARAIAVIRPGGEINAQWLALCLRSPLSQHLLTSRANTTVQTTINLKDLRALPIPIPPQAQRNDIAHMMYAIDERITELRETNATLEAIAQALFKSWFVDFDPVRAKQEGRDPEGIAAATAALFPDKFEETEWGMIPRGWSVGCVRDFALQSKVPVNPLLLPGRIFEHYSLPAYDNNQTPVLELGEAIRSNKTVISSEVVLLSKLNPHIPRIWIPVQTRENAVCSTEFLAFLPSANGSSKEFIYCYFSAPSFIMQLQQLVTGTSNSHQRVKPDQILQLKAVIPPQEVLCAFSEIAKPIFMKVHESRKQSQILAELRSTLLPRLISGQLRLSRGEEQCSTTLATS